MALTILLAGLTVLIVGVVTGYTGFAFNLLAVPLLALLIPIRDAVGIGIVISFVILTIMTLRDVGEVEWPTIRLLVGGALIGFVVGGTISVGLSEETLRIVVGSLTVVLAVYLFIKQQPKVRPRPPWLAVSAGTAAGILGSVSGMGGPPLVAYLTHAFERPQQVRATLAAYAMIAAPLNLTALLVMDAVPGSVLWQGGLLAIAAFVGMMTGTRLFRAVPGPYARAVAVTLVAAAAAGVSLAFTG